MDGPAQLEMDEFGPLDQNPAMEMDEEEAANLLADEGFTKVVHNKVKPNTQPKPQPKPQPQIKSQPNVPPRSPPSPAPHGSQLSPIVPSTNPRDPLPQPNPNLIKPLKDPKTIQPFMLNNLLLNLTLKSKILTEAMVFPAHKKSFFSYFYGY
jgi:hypothetical protein